MQWTPRVTVAAHPNDRIIVALSGGVDSAVAALLMKRQGYVVSGVLHKNWEDDDTESDCPSREDLIDAVAVAERLGIDIEVVNFAAEYRQRVFSRFLAELQAGRTPNPDVVCNREVRMQGLPRSRAGVGCWLYGHGTLRTDRTSGRAVATVAGDRPGQGRTISSICSAAQLAHGVFPIGHA